MVHLATAHCPAVDGQRPTLGFLCSGGAYICAATKSAHSDTYSLLCASPPAIRYSPSHKLKCLICALTLPEGIALSTLCMCTGLSHLVGRDVVDADLEASQEIVLQQIVQFGQALVDVDAAVDDVLSHLLGEKS